MSFLTDFKWSSRCGCCFSLADSSVCGCFCKNMLLLTLWFLFACEWTFAEGQNSNTSKSICYKTLIDNCSPGLSGKSRAMQLHCRFTRHLLIQYSRCPCLPVIQTACLACVTAVGISNFTPCHQIKRAAGAGGSQDRVLCAAAILGHVWTIQHGCHQSSPGVCSCWVMASHWSPDQAESGLHIKHVLFSDKPGDLCPHGMYIHLYSNRHLLLMNTNYINNRITTEIPEVLVFCFVEFFEFVFWEGK